MNVRIILAMLIAAQMLFHAPSARAESQVSWSSVGDDAEALLKAPFEMNGDDVLRTAVAGATIGATMIWADDYFDRLVREEPDEMPWLAARKLAWLTTWYGENGRNAMITAAGITGAVAAGGYFSDDDRMLDTAVIMAESVVFSMVITGVTKMFVGRKRPHDNSGPHDFEWFVGPFRREALSFPSGHAATAFALAGAGAGRYPHWYVQVPAYVLATSAGLQRMDARAHWASDVLTGTLLGYAVSSFLVDRYDDGSAAPGDGASLSLSFSIKF
ncbi:MAG TPA: phosphatase PAP2 family protein [Candidatus Krumholzibacteria bacterium]|nr:phosphatase PAP2 family protein [Candidatus Krumholzibacteria bacterium]